MLDANLSVTVISKIHNLLSKSNERKMLKKEKKKRKKNKKRMFNSKMNEAIISDTKIENYPTGLLILITCRRVLDLFHTPLLWFYTFSQTWACAPISANFALEGASPRKDHSRDTTLL